MTAFADIMEVQTQTVKANVCNPSPYQMKVWDYRHDKGPPKGPLGHLPATSAIATHKPLQKLFASAVGQR